MMRSCKSTCAVTAPARGRACRHAWYVLQWKDFPTTCKEHFLRRDTYWAGDAVFLRFNSPSTSSGAIFKKLITSPLSPPYSTESEMLA